MSFVGFILFLPLLWLSDFDWRLVQTPRLLFDRLSNGGIHATTLLMPTTSYHFSGIAGAGMNPLAQLMRAWGQELIDAVVRSADIGGTARLAPASC